jgi:protein-S-isoprenylcysteine O-methyltransferase Ste14
MFRQFIPVLATAWGLSEIVLSIVRRSRGGNSTSRDRGSLGLLTATIYPSVILAVVCANLPVARYGVTLPVAIVALSLFAIGIVLRWTAIITLGRYFTVNVAIHEGHRIVDRGLYRWIRHPSYTGALLSFLGFSVAMGSWISLALMTIPIGAAFLYRMRVEEEALVGAFGEDYVRYMARTKRLVPGVY